MKNNNVYFVIETMISDENGRKLQQLEPDQDGWYNKIPVAVVNDNVITRNQTAYDSESLLKHVFDKNSLFNLRLQEGDLFGEYNHPFLGSGDINNPNVLARLLWLDPDKKAAHYRKFEVDQDPSLKLKLLYSTLKPMGPYGKYAKEMLDDPYVNFSTSLRGLSTEENQNGIKKRKLFKLVTFDVCVPSAGYKYANKRYTKVSTESILDLISHEGLIDVANHNNSIALESILTNTEINDILKLTKIQLNTKISAYKVDEDILYIKESKEEKSIYGIIGKII